MRESDKIELRSDEVQEILSRPPHALIRYGISIICSSILILFIGSFFFRYPDIVQAEVVITTENPPVWLVARSTGKIKELYCKDNQKVKQGDLLAVIDNAANTTDVQIMTQLLNNVVVSDTCFSIPNDLLNQSYELGIMQSSFSAFSKAAMNYSNFRSLNSINQEKTSLYRQIVDRNTYLFNLQKQLDMKRKGLVLSKSAYERDVQLSKKNIISSSDMETSEQTYLSKQQEFQQLQTSISLEKAETTKMTESVSKLSLQYFQEKKQLYSDLKSAHRELLAVIESWQQNCLLIASQTGIVSFNSFWKQNQFVNSGDKVFAIVPRLPGQLIGKLKVPASGSGKIKIGQLVNIKVSSYPYMEYGILQARTENISLVPNNDFYSVEVSFPKGLCSNVNKNLKFTGEMNGIAEVITDNQTLLERFFSPVKFLAKKFFE